MKKALLSAAVSVSLALMASILPAQDRDRRSEDRVDRDRRAESDEDYLEAGRWEFSLSVLGSWSRQTGSNAEQTSVGGELGLGFFLTSWLEPGIKVEYIHQDTEIQGTEVETNSALAAGTLTLNLPTETRVVPFLTGSGGVVYADLEENDNRVSDDTGAFWEAGAGFRIFVSSWAALNFKVTFQQFLLDDEGDINAVVGVAGISLFF